MNMTRIFTVVLLFTASFAFAQDQLKPKVEKMGDLTAVTYYHDNGAIAQYGTFNQQGKLQGVWTSFDAEGNKTMVGNYDNNKKVGKWLLWSDNTLREVEYVDSRVASVSEWQDKVQLAIND